MPRPSLTIATGDYRDSPEYKALKLQEALAVRAAPTARKRTSKVESMQNIMDKFAGHLVQTITKHMPASAPKNAKPVKQAPSVSYSDMVAGQRNRAAALEADALLPPSQRRYTSLRTLRGAHRR